MNRSPMRQHRRRPVHMLAALLAMLPLALVGALLLGGLLPPATAAATAAAAPVAPVACAGPVTGERVYDCANLLTPAEVADLETQAAAVAQVGAPTVVYLQARDATAQQALQDAIDLMNRWNVESRPGAKDGFVMFFDLQPGNLRHGEVALYAGAKHYAHGNLPQAELDRIRTDVMTPLLQDGQTAAGIAAGLQQVAHDLRYGPPPPPASQVVAANLGRIPFNVLSLLLAGVVGLLTLRLRLQAPMSSASDGVGLGSLATPGDLPPAEAGALVNGRISDAQMEATMLDFGRRGLLAVEPEGADNVRVRLLGDGKGLAGYEQAIWNSLSDLADDDRTIFSDQLAHLRPYWHWAEVLLRRKLVEQGWYDPAAAAARRRPLYLTGVVCLFVALVALVLIGLAQEGWAAIGFVILVLAAVAAFVRGHAVPNTTVEGELAAAPWRAYLASVTAHDYEPNLDTDLPYVVALGIVNKLAPRLKAASEAGYSPSWFRAASGSGSGSGGGQRMPPHMGFYPYWLAFHTSTIPASSGGGGGGGSASGGYAGGGAAGGGGGSAGSF